MEHEDSQLRQLEQEIVGAALDHAGGDLDLMAELLGVTPAKLRGLLVRYGLTEDV